VNICKLLRAKFDLFYQVTVNLGNCPSSDFIQLCHLLIHIKNMICLTCGQVYRLLFVEFYPNLSITFSMHTHCFAEINAVLLAVTGQSE